MSQQTGGEDREESDSFSSACIGLLGGWAFRIQSAVDDVFDATLGVGAEGGAEAWLLSLVHFLSVAQLALPSRCLFVGCSKRELLHSPSPVPGLLLGPGQLPSSTLSLSIWGPASSLPFCSTHGISIKTTFRSDCLGQDVCKRVRERELIAIGSIECSGHSALSCGIQRDSQHVTSAGETGPVLSTGFSKF